jgi:hypothetical protein
VTAQDFAKHGCFGILSQYGGSPRTLLLAVFPEFNWLPWRFSLPSNYWDLKSNKLELFSHLKQKYNIKSSTDWIRDITRRILVDEGAEGILTKYGTFGTALKATFPRVKWDNVASSSLVLAKSCSKGHLNLIHQLKRLGESDIKINYKHPFIRHSKSQKPIEIDIFLPSQKLVAHLFSSPEKNLRHLNTTADTTLKRYKAGCGDLFPFSKAETMRRGTSANKTTSPS